MPLRRRIERDADGKRKQEETQFTDVVAEQKGALGAASCLRQDDKRRKDDMQRDKDDENGKRQQCGDQKENNRAAGDECGDRMQSAPPLEGKSLICVCFH